MNDNEKELINKLLKDKPHLKCNRLYINSYETVKKILSNPDNHIIEKRIDELASKINRDYEGKEVLCVGILKGSVIFLADIVRKLDVTVSMDFMIVSSYGESTETSGQLNIKKDLSTDIKGKHVLIIEDIIDSGITLSKLVEILKEREPASVEICALLNKPERRLAHVDAKYIGFEIPNEFIIGYGLDYAEKYRELPYVGVLKREIYE